MYAVSLLLTTGIFLGQGKGVDSNEATPGMAYIVNSALFDSYSSMFSGVSP